LLVIIYSHDTRIALDGDVVILPPDPAAPNSVAFSLSPMALKEGARRLEWRSWRLADAKLHAWLAHWVYDDREPWQLLRNAWFIMLLCLALNLPLSVRKDLVNHRIWYLRGALKRAGLVSRSQFHRCARHHRGVGWLTTNPVSLWERIFVNPSERRRVRIPAQHETEHVLIVGDGGTGKSSLLRQLLVHVQERNETAIIYDPAMEYVPQFFNPERGDVILNPLDERMPYWDLADELEDRDKAEAIARSLIPDRGTQDRLHVEAPRQILAHLLRFYPSARKLSGWIANPEPEINDRVFGTPLEGFISRDKPRERARVLAVLGRVRNILDVLPSKSRARHWTTTQWAERREGWVFVTTLPSTREKLQPLVNLWLDLLLSTLARPTDCSVEPVWVVIDYPASPSNLRMAPNAIWESRRSNSRFVLALKSRSEPPRSYGHDIKAELSHFGTKIFLRTKDLQAANWVAGRIESGHVATSRTTNIFDAYHSNDASDDRDRERGALVSTIGSLENLEGFLQMREFLLKLHFRYTPPGKHQPAFVPLAATDSATATATESTTLGGFPSADEDVQPEDSRTDLSLNKRTSDRRHRESQPQDQPQPQKRYRIQ
jgi:hypothetical protein